MILVVGQAGRAIQTMKPIGVPWGLPRRRAKTKGGRSESGARVKRFVRVDDSQAGAALIEWDLNQAASDLGASQGRLGTRSPAGRTSTSATGVIPACHPRVAG
jgi:hypothetical protein